MINFAADIKLWRMRIKHFIRNSVNVLRSASRGEYEHESEAVRAIRREMMERPSSLRTDRENLAADRRRVAADVRISFNRLVLG